jgi:hypothetical protein
MDGLKTGDILHCTRKSLLSWLIRKATRSKFNHSALIIEIWEQIYIVDSQKDGTQVRPFCVWQKKYGYRYEISRPAEINKKEFSKKALSRTDTGYDFSSLLIRGPWKLLTGRWKKKKNEFDKMYCSEFVAFCHEIEYDSIMSPQDLWEYCEEHPEIFKNI